MAVLMVTAVGAGLPSRMAAMHCKAGSQTWALAQATIAVLQADAPTSKSHSCAWRGNPKAAAHRARPRQAPTAPGLHVVMLRLALRRAALHARVTACSQRLAFAHAATAAPRDTASG